jgi:hypothetical protein
MDEMTLRCAGPAAKKNYVSIKETAPCKEKSWQEQALLSRVPVWKNDYC